MVTIHILHEVKLLNKDNSDSETDKIIKIRLATSKQNENKQ